MQSAPSAKAGVVHPLLPIVIHAARAKIPLLALVDSGADYSILPHYLASALGVNLDECEKCPCITAAGDGFVLRHHMPLEAEIQAMRTKFAMTSAFSEHARVVLLGRADFFSRFEVSIDNRRQVFTLHDYEDFDPTPISN